MDLFSNCKLPRLFGSVTTCKCLAFFTFALFFRAIFLHSFSGTTAVLQRDNRLEFSNSGADGIRRDKFLEVPQIVWGLNNQKIAFARACLTARTLNRTLLMPSLSASLFYKEIEKLQPLSFDKIFNFQKFNSLCGGFVRLGRCSDLKNKTSSTYELRKGSGRKWTVERDIEQLKQSKTGFVDEHEVIKIVGKNPFQWHDHWEVKDYAKIFECLVLVDEISNEADKVVSKISAPYIAVHMRVEIDWMIHCKNLEKKSNTNQICSSKEEIIERVGKIFEVVKESPIFVYLAVADSLLNDSSILSGWRKGLIPLEKKKLGVYEIYKKHPYLIQSAIDYEVCSRADVFVGNSFSTFSSLVVLERTTKMIRMGITSSCDDDDGVNVRWPSYAYNIPAGAAPGESNRPHKWMTNMSGSSLKAISYGTNSISCQS